MTEVAACRKRRWDATQRMRVAARSIAPVDEVILVDEAGEVCRIGVTRKTVSRYDTGVNFRGGTGDGVAPVLEIALPRLRWLERDEI